MNKHGINEISLAEIRDGGKLGSGKAMLVVLSLAIGTVIGEIIYKAVT